MSEHSTGKRSDYWAGLCVLALGVVALAITILIGYIRANPLGTIRYNVVFAVADGVEGVEPGSRIYYGGIDIGQVEQVVYVDHELKVVIAVDRDVRLHPGVQIQRASSLIGGASSLMVTVIGDTMSNPLPKDSKILAAPVASGTANLLGTANASRLDRIQKSIAKAWEGIEEVEAQFGSIGKASQELAELAKEAQGDFESWEPKVTQIEARLGTLGERLGSLQADTKPITTTATRLSSDFEHISQQFTGPKWEELKKNVEALTASFKEIATEFEEKVMPQVERVLDKAQASWTQLLATAGQLQELAAHGRSTIDIFIANSTLAAQQLKLTESEVLSTLGLDLLERPSAADVQLLVREAAMRDWTQSAIEIREILRAIETLKLEGMPDAEADRVLKQLLNTLRETLAQYEQAQQRLFESADSDSPTE